MKTLMFKLLTVTIFFLMFGFSYAQSNGSVSGSVKDRQSGENLTGASVYLENTHWGAAVGVHGDFSLPKIPAGNYNIIVTMVGYETLKKPVTVVGGEDTKIEVYLQAAPFRVSDVVVTATRSEELVTSVPVATEILNSVRLKESNAQNVGQALESVGAALVKSYGATGSLSTITMRGSTNSQVLILVDGQKLNGADNGSVDLSMIPLDAVEKIEVVKGGHAALYGSDAVGGVINIFTKSMARKKNLEFSTRATLGSFNTQIYDVSAGQGIGNLDYYVSYNRTKTDGDFEYTNNEQKREKLLNADNSADDIFAKVGYMLPDQSRISIFHQYHFANNGSPGSIEFPNALARNKIDRHHTSIAYDGYCTGIFAIKGQGYLMFSNQRYINPAAWDGLEENLFKNRALGLTIQAFTDADFAGMLSYGYEFRQDKLESNFWINNVTQNFLGDHERNVHSFFLQDDWKYQISPDWKVTAVPAVRWDKYPEAGIGNQLSPKLGITLSNNSEWRGSIRGNVGKVFRAPTYSDLYWPEDSWTKGNPDLRPEKGTTYDGGFIVQFRQAGFWSIEATYFASIMDDLILWAPESSAPDAKWLPKNVARAYTRGIESKAGWNGFNEHVNVQFGYTYMKATDDGNDPLTKGKFLIYQPEHKFDINLNLNYSIASFNMNYQKIGQRYHDAQNLTPVDSYSMINTNLGLTQEFAGVKWNLRFEVNNLGNKDLQITKGSPVPGREFRVSLGINGSLFAAE
ncbi:MAG: TonB-dependent receptor [Ignavibacteriales bacterium]